MRRLWRWWGAAFYRFSGFTLPLLLRLLGRLEIEHAERVPREGPALIAANHLSLVDPVLVCAAAPRRVRPIAKRELFETPLIGWVVWLYGAFPVRRYSADMGALRAGRNHLRAGRAVLVCPEGTRSPDAAMRPALPGAAMMALLAPGTPIVPCAITGTEDVKGPRSILRALSGRRRTSIRVVFGEPFALGEGSPDTARAEAAADAIMRRIAALLPPSYRGVYALAAEGGPPVVARRDAAAGGGRA